MSSGVCDQTLQSSGILGQVQGDSGKEGEIWQGLQKRGDPGPGALESHTALEFLSRPGPTALGTRELDAEPSTEGASPRVSLQELLRGPHPHQLQLLVHLGLSLSSTLGQVPEPL